MDPKLMFKLVVEKANEHERQLIRLKQKKPEPAERDQDKSKKTQPAKPKKDWNYNHLAKQTEAVSAKARSNWRPAHSDNNQVQQPGYCEELGSLRLERGLMKWVRHWV
ncbi:hypothetical protein PHYSODRAFT_330609 [Phytophthora sojae]|uniref:Uncharacterized protein n=1 Tax=Phytophthora sojae (strain P6497) TaxID=1094619 RepID=G4ZEM1_PHYSP|nr:hypothetical protein PHYSODRAFT_330609 [Phytophthora sojae]EGZ16544.1 hypothetical protein PHYSODRAFT_330609 [Phytophthora sojae]|eukprot:XP_009525602.1 hypothetical protein PHYSODRAFT_330609 [Phytophthora sojae]